MGRPRMDDPAQRRLPMSFTLSAATVSRLAEIGKWRGTSSSRLVEEMIEKEYEACKDLLGSDSMAVLQTLDSIIEKL